MDTAQILWTVLLLLANGMAAILWKDHLTLKRDVKQLEREASELRELLTEEMTNLKFNYLDRFDALKGQISQMDLRFTQKFVKLTTLLEEHLKQVTNKQQG